MAFIASRTGIIVLTLITGVIHLALGIFQSDTLFLLNGVGYLVLLYLTFWAPAFLSGQASLIRWAFIAFTLVTIIAYFGAWGLEGFSQPVGLLTKIVEVLLLIGLWRSK